MSLSEKYSLIDLSKQFPFEITDAIKKEICFSETLIVSCGHYDGEPDVKISDSIFTCTQSTPSSTTNNLQLPTGPYEIRDKILEGSGEQGSSEDNDFRIFFFPDCDKPLKQDSRASLTIVDGFPKINRKAKSAFCTCEEDKKGRCVCFANTPCNCGAVELDECTCKQQKNICICDENMPQPVCTCKESDVCLCHPDQKPRPVCTCEEDVARPCMCHPDRFPFRVCECPRKPNFLNKLRPTIECIEESNYEGELEETTEETKEEEQPCTCQIVPKEICFCKKESECTCRKDACICGYRNSCVCRKTSNEEIPCHGADSQSICSCDKPKACTCGSGSDVVCSCFPQHQRECTCGNPEQCKCQKECDCSNPCLCGLAPKDEEECVCLDPAKKITKGIDCSCDYKEKEVTKMKKVRAKKEGYRWCHDVDPHHTFFDYAYGRHDNIVYGEKPLPKVEILGLHDDEITEGTASKQGVEAPPYVKNPKKYSLDCCSTVGGISISIQSLGGEEGKFLIQVVSNTSKDGAKSGSKLVSIVDSNLHTMEENRTEHLIGKNDTIEKHSYLAICETGYYNKITCKCNDRSTIKRRYHLFDNCKDFLLEGANVFLIRYFGLSRYRGNIKTDCVLIGGQICESVYVSKGVSQAVVNGRPLFVVKVERHIIQPNGTIQQTLTVVTLRGYMVSHEWADNNCIIHINPLLRIVPEKDEIEPHAPLRETWREDLQLFSDFLDFKSKRTEEGGRYAQESGDLSSTIRDYLQALLMLKPSDALHFTRHYFGSVYSAMDLPHNEFFEPSDKHVHYFYFED